MSRRLDAAPRILFAHRPVSCQHPPHTVHMCDAPTPTPVCPIPCVPCDMPPLNPCDDLLLGVQGVILGTACTAGQALVLVVNPELPGAGRFLKAVPVTVDTAVPASFRYTCEDGEATLSIWPAHAESDTTPAYVPLRWWFPPSGPIDPNRFYAFISTTVPPIGAVLSGPFFFPFSDTSTDPASLTNCGAYPLQIDYTVGGPNPVAPFLSTTFGTQESLVVVKNDGTRPELLLELGTVVVAPYLNKPPVVTTQAASVDALADFPVPLGLGVAYSTVFSPIKFHVVTAEVLLP